MNLTISHAAEASSSDIITITVGSVTWSESAATSFTYSLAADAVTVNRTGWTEPQTIEIPESCSVILTPSVALAVHGPDYLERSSFFFLVWFWAWFVLKLLS